MTETGVADEPRGLRKFTQFGRDFWVINFIELLERGAYYSLAPVFGIFMLDVFQGNGMSPGQAGALAGTLTAVNMFLLYAVPLFAAALAEKFGYRAALVVSFLLLVGGYATTLVAGDVATILVAAALIGFGAGIFKPIAAAMVSQTSTENQRNAAFAIYYGCINLGAFIFPTAVAIVAAVYFPEQLIPVAFGTAALLSLVNLTLVFTVFRNVNPPRSDVSILGSFAALTDVFKQPAFLVLLLIYSGFWFMYALNLTFLSAYMIDFARMPTWFAPTLVVSLNALVIIVGAPLIAVLTDRFTSLSLMTVGIAGYALSLIVVGWSATPTLFVAGIIAFSIFELVTHPSYLAYVSKIAPPDKVSVYLGYGFLPIAFGLTVGSAVGGALYGTIALEQGLPQRFWSIITGVGLATVALLLVYNTALTGIRARGEATLTGDAPARRSFASRLGGPAGAVAAVLLIPALVFGSTFAGTGEGDAGVGALDVGDLTQVDLDLVEQVTQERQRTAVPLSLPADATGAGRLVLEWEDEAAQAGRTNMPDRFVIHLTMADGTALTSEESNSGRAELLFTAIPGEHLIEIELVEAGDHVVTFGGVSLTQGGEADTGNAWTLARSYEAPATG